MAVEGLLLANAYCILLCMDATKRWLLSGTVIGILQKHLVKETCQFTVSAKESSPDRAI
jgi:hypothetical protein